MAVDDQNGFGSRIRLGRWTFFASVVIALIVLQAFGTLEHLRLETATPSLEIWRLATGHMIHVNWSHLVLNVVAFLLVWILVGGAFGALAWIAVAIACMAAVNIGLLMFSPDVVWYAGLSGLLHGLVVAGLVASSKRLGLLGAGLLLGILIKLFLEHFDGGSSAVEQMIGASVIFDAHLYGTVGGLGVGVVVLWKHHVRDKVTIQNAIPLKTGWQ